MRAMARAARVMAMATKKVIARKRAMTSNNDRKTMVTKTRTRTTITTATNTMQRTTMLMLTLTMTMETTMKMTTAIVRRRR
jgi:hypothetical protein